MLVVGCLWVVYFVRLGCWFMLVNSVVCFFEFVCYWFILGLLACCVYKIAFVVLRCWLFVILCVFVCFGLFGLVWVGLV